ncbi:MAG: ECF transporter S component [Clostridia bacterium]|nr:ECF transporter S component [Clostridia bacterium]
MKTSVQKTVFASLLAALVCVATMIIKLPSPLGGYMNLGDCVVLLSGWMLTPFYGFLAAGIGSLLADIFSGFILYAPITFLTKGLMAICAHFVFKLTEKRMGNFPSRILSGTFSEIIMISSYYIFEGFLYGFIPALSNMPANIIQGVFGLILGIILIKIFEKHIIHQL